MYVVATHTAYHTVKSLGMVIDKAIYFGGSHVRVPHHKIHTLTMSISFHRISFFFSSGSIPRNLFSSNSLLFP